MHTVHWLAVSGVGGGGGGFCPMGWGGGVLWVLWEGRPPCEQKNTCENITSPQLRLRAVVSCLYFRTNLFTSQMHYHLKVEPQLTYRKYLIVQRFL